MLEGFLFYYNFVSADSCGFARRGGTRSSEGRFPSSRSSPPATGNGLLPALRAKRLLRAAASDALSPKANSSSVCLRRLTFNPT